MGHDLHIIGPHSLDTSSQEALARDLSERLEANVEYGYFNWLPCDLEGKGRKISNPQVIFGKINYPKATKTLWLNDEFHQIHQLIAKHGDGIYELPYFRHENDLHREIREAINSVCFEIRDCEQDQDYGTIYNDTFHNYYNYFYPRWWCFCNAFMQDNTYDLPWEHIYNSGMYQYRQEVMHFCSLIGVPEVFYIDDQGETAEIALNYDNWDTKLNQLKTRFKDTTLHISNFMKQRTLLPQGKYPLAFFDDFEDLKSKQPQ